MSIDKAQFHSFMIRDLYKMIARWKQVLPVTSFTTISSGALSPYANGAAGNRGNIVYSMPISPTANNIHVDELEAYLETVSAIINITEG